MVATAATQSCILCGLPAPHPLTNDTGDIFCCPACREVLGLLHADDSTIEASAAVVAAETESVDLTLGGMWCLSCGWLIAENLRRTDGIQTADVSFARQEARVIYDPTQISPGQITKRVRRSGYKAWVAGEEDNYDEEERHFERLLIGLVLAMHVMLISLFLYIRQIVGGAPVETEWLATFFEIILLAAATPLMFLFGIPIMRAGIASLINRQPNMHALIALGAFSAYGMSLRNLITGSGNVYFDTASMLLFLVAIGRWLDIRARKTSRDAVDRLWEQVPTLATWLSPAGEQQVAIDELPPGARIRVRPGERFPVDGIIAEGAGDIDESLLTGEHLPITRQNGDRVMAGTISLDGAFDVITTAIGAETTAGQIGRLLHQALWAQAPIQQLVDRIAGWLIPAALLLATATLAFWTITADLETGLLNALSVLVIACPCALGLATPLTLWHGVRRAADGGVILQNSGALEQLARIQHVAFDKTGTLTSRDFRLTYVATNGTDESLFLSRVAAAETLSEHPLGQAIVAGVEARDMTLPPATNFRAIPGRGVTADVGSQSITVGNAALMRQHDLTLPELFQEQTAHWQADGMTVVYAGWDGVVRGLIALGEDERQDVLPAIAELKAMDLGVTVLTGDHASAGERWAAHLDVPVVAALRPEDKIAQLEDLSGPVAMVGDGINDGPALASASVGVALSDGTDVARAAADAVLLSEDLRTVPWIIGLGQATMRRVRQNLAWAAFYNVIGLGLAATGLLSPILSALAMVLSSAIVTTNALRLRKHPLLEVS